MKYFTLKTKLLLSFFLVTSFSIVITTFFSIGYFSDKMNTEAEQNLQKGIQVAELIYENNAADIRNLSLSLASDKTLQLLVRFDFIGKIVEYLSERAELQRPNLYVSVISSKGEVLSVLGESETISTQLKAALPDMIHFKKMLEGEKETLLLSTEKIAVTEGEDLLAICSSNAFAVESGILSSDEDFAGGVIVQQVLNNDTEIVSSIEKLLDMQAAIYHRAVPISESADLRIDTEIYQKLIRGDAQYAGRADFVRGGFLTRYTAVKDLDEKAVGVLGIRRSADPFVDTRRRAVMTLLAMMAGCLVGASLLGYVLARSIVVPINHLLHGVQTITSGDLSHELEVRSQDELGTLALAFNSMAQQLKGLFNTLEQRVEAATRELQSTLAYMSTIIDNMADGLLATDPDGRITRANPALKIMLGFGEDRLEGLESDKVFAEDVRELVAATSSGREQYASAEVQLANERIGKAVATAIFKDSDVGEAFQDCIGSVILVRDITREKEVDQMKTDFISTVSHELRTPLTSVLGFTKIIKKRFEKVLLPQLEGVTEKKTARAVGQVQDNLDIIIAEGERLTKLINDVLDVAKMEAGKIDWKMEKLSVGEIIDRATVATSALFTKKGLAQIKDIPDDIPVITGDRDRLIQVVINLISNAVKFTDEGSVTCQVRQEKNDLIVRVIDTGDGISEADQPKVFEKFKQVGDTLTDKPKGTGLGLPICKQIIEHHGGRIWVESRLGEGSTFSFSLPVLLESTLESRQSDKVLFFEHARQKAELQEHEGPKSILVVDDEASIRKLLRQELEPEGYRVLEAKNGAEAIEMAWKDPPFAIVMDVLMPEMNGFEAAGVLKSDPLTMDVPIVILSVLEGQEMGYHFGIDCYLPKPIDTRQLLQNISELSSLPAARQSILIGGDGQSTVVPLIELLSSSFNVLGTDDFSEYQKLALTEVPALLIVDEAFAEEHKEVYSLHEEKSLKRLFLVVLGEEKADA